MDLVIQDSNEKRHKQSTIPTALVKDKERKQEPIQKIHKNTNQTKTHTPGNQHKRKTTVEIADNKIGHYTNAQQRRQNAITATNWDTSQEYAAAKPKTRKKG